MRSLHTQTPTRHSLWATVAAACAVSMALLIGGAAGAQCPANPGDVTGDGNRTVVDVQCLLLTVTAELANQPHPVCLVVPPEEADLNCDAAINVVDAQISITIALTGGFPAAVDTDGDGCADSCDLDPCGDGTCDATEDCSSCPDDCTCPPSAFRISELAIADPHFWLGTAFGCVDLMGGVLGDFVNDSLAAQLEEPDALDLILVFRPLNPAAATSDYEFINGDCQAGTCSAAGALGIESTVSNQTTGTCAGPVAGTLNPAYAPPPVAPPAPCFTSDGYSLALDVIGLQIPFTEVVVSASYQSAGGSVVALENGLMAGFVSEAAVNAITLPVDFPLVGGQPLSTLLKGGQGNVCGGDDRDTYLGQSGWWVYFEYTATAVSWSE